MCATNPQTVTLQTAVQIVVGEFAKQNRTFSVHEVTNEIRTKVNSGELEIPEAETNGAASFRYDISHVKVKDLFNELWRNNVFDPQFTLSRQFTGVFWQYSPSPVASPAPTTPAFIPTVTSPSFTSAFTTATRVTVASNGSSDNKSRISTYLNGCASKNFRPTLKQVQSGIKRKDTPVGLNCEDIKAIVISLGFKVIDNPESVSKAQVAVV